MHVHYYYLIPRCVLLHAGSLVKTLFNKVLTNDPVRQRISKLYCVFISLHLSILHLVFKNEKGELTILTTKHSLLVSETKWKVCFLTTTMTLLSYKSENFFSDPRSADHHGHLLS